MFCNSIKKIYLRDLRSDRRPKEIKNQRKIDTRFEVSGFSNQFRCWSGSRFIRFGFFLFTARYWHGIRLNARTCQVHFLFITRSVCK